MASFDPHTQNVTFFLADGETPVHVPIPQIDGNVVYTASVCINYGTQMGAAFAMLLVTLIMTPFAKLRRPSGILQLLVLSLCVIRMALLSAYFPSGFNEFYNILSGDFSTVPRSDFHTSVIANTFSLLLVFAVELALMHQAWAMVALWPDIARYTLSALSLLITLLTVGWRLAATTIQSKAVLSLTSTQDTLWVAQWAVITNAISICWFCALFNAKLVAHLITNHGVLPTRKSLSPMEVLVMTNGVLMIIPVIFAGLEFGRFANFEAASLTLTSVALILPLGTLATQRVSQRYGILSIPGDVNTPNDSTLQGSAPSFLPFKDGSVSFGSTSGTITTANQVSVSSRCEAVGSRDPIDVELGEIDNDRTSAAHGQVRVNQRFEQREERLW